MVLCRGVIRAEDIQVSWPHGRQVSELRGLKFNCALVIRNIKMERRRQID